jgi:catechol 2,3-dioxygenase-like lactoylglutathione lyase family enzyme
MLQVDHLDLNVSDLRNSEKFYDLIGPQLGLRKTLSSDDLIAYTDGFFGLYLVPSDMNRKFAPHGVGLNHLCFRADSREKVTAFFEFLTLHECDVLKAPRESSQYPEGYFSFFFRDPDRIRLEYAFCPRR